MEILFDVLGSLHEPHAAHNVVSIFHAEDFSYLFRYSDSPTCYYFSEEGNVFFLNLDRQLLASGKWLRTQ